MEAHDLVEGPREPLLGPGRRHGHREHDALCPALAQCLRSRDGSASGGEPVVDDGRRAPSYLGGRAIVAEEPHSAFELPRLVLGRLAQLLLGDRKLPECAVIDQRDPFLGDRPDCEFALKRRPQLPDYEHIQRRTQCQRHLIGDRHTAAWQPNHNGPLVAEAVQRGGQPAPGVTPVAEERL